MENEQAIRKKRIQMTTAPVEKLVCRMAVPTIISMLISTFYNMVDTLFVGRLSTEATAAVGVAFSLMSFIQAIGFLFGHGSGNYISRALGNKQIGPASKMAATGFFSAFFCGCLIAVLGISFLTPFARFLGATETILPYAKDYMRIILLGAPFMMAAIVLNNQLRLQGNAFFAMIGITSGGVLNIFLDPLFIFTFKMGVSGAALATIVSQIVSFILLWIGCGKSSNLNIEWKKFSPSFQNYRIILGGGLPSLCRQGLISISTIALNHFAGVYGDAALAAFSIVSRITNFASSALIGFGQGFQPVCGFNFGAGLYSRVKRAFWFSVKVSTVVFTILGLIGFTFAPGLIALFRKSDPAVIAIGADALRYQCVAFPLLGLITLSNMFLQNIGETVKASILSAARQGLFFLPALLVFSIFAGLAGIEAAQPVSDLFAFLLALPLAMITVRKMPQDRVQNLS